MTFFQFAAEAGTGSVKQLAYSRASAIASVLVTSVSDVLNSVPFISEYIGIEGFHRTCDRLQISFDKREELALKLDDIWRLAGDAELDSSIAKRLVQSEAGESDGVLIELIKLGLKAMPQPVHRRAERGILSRIGSLFGGTTDSDESTTYRRRYENLERIVGEEH